MNAEAEYLRSEAKNILATTDLVEEQLRDLAKPAVKFCREFLKEIC